MKSVKITNYLLVRNIKKNISNKVKIKNLQIRFNTLYIKLIYTYIAYI